MGYLDGFRVTIAKLQHSSDTGAIATVKYPQVKRPKPERFHGRHVLNRYEDGMEKCIGCELCAGVCPARCIYVRGADNDPANPTSPGERYGFVYEINYLRCIHCDMCVEACPTEAITESKIFEFSFTNRSDAIYEKHQLLTDDAGNPRPSPGRTSAPATRSTPPAGCGRRRPRVTPTSAACRCGRRARLRRAHPRGGPVRRGRGARRPPRRLAGVPRRSRRCPRARLARRAPLMVEWIVFVAGAAIALAGAIGVVSVRNPVHAALLLVLTLIGVAVLFVTMDAHFLAAVQIIVYAGAVVVLFLFVIMLLGVDQAEDVRTEPIAGQRPVAIAMGVASFALLVTIVAVRVDGSIGRPPLEAFPFQGTNVERLSHAVFTRYLFPFEITSLLLVIAVVGAVLLARRPEPLPEGGA